MILLWVIIGIAILFGFVVLFGAPYVPTLNKELGEAFSKLYAVGPNDTVVDLGAGDGRVVRAAVAKGAVAYGYELNPLLVLIAKLRVGRTGRVQLRDMWSVKLPQSTTLVYVFTVSRDSKRLRNYLQQEANRLNAKLAVMTFGPTFKDLNPVATHRGHALYEFRPSKR